MGTVIKRATPEREKECPLSERRVKRLSTSSNVGCGKGRATSPWKGIPGCRSKIPKDIPRIYGVINQTVPPTGGREETEKHLLRP